MKANQIATSFFVGILMLASCGDGQKRQSNGDTVHAEATTPDSYRILSETTSGKCKIEVELRDKVSKDELVSIANGLHENRLSCEKLWIFHYLPGTKPGAGAWAITHFTPDLEVEIIGSTKEEEAKVREKAKEVDGKVIGEFQEQQYTSASYTVYNKSKKTHIKTVFKDGSSSNAEMKEKTVPGGTRLNYKDGRSNGEYFILTTAGVLEFYNAEHKMFTKAERAK